MSRPYRKNVPLWSAEAAMAMLVGLAVVALRAIAIMFAVNWTIAPWTDVRINSWAGLGIVLLLGELQRILPTKEDA